MNVVMTAQTRLYIISFVLCLSLGFGYFRVSSLFSAEVLGAQTDLSPEEIVAMCNVVRQQIGLSPLRMNASLQLAAKHKAEAMIREQYWAHTNPETGQTPWSYIDETGYTYALAGENLAKGFQSSVTLVNAWMQSKPHRDNLLNPDYQEIGVYVISSTKLLNQKTSVIVQFMASPLTGTTLSTQLNTPPPIESNGTSFEILSIKPLLLLFGASGLGAFFLTVLLTLLHDRRAQTFRPPKQLWHT